MKHKLYSDHNVKEVTHPEKITRVLTPMAKGFSESETGGAIAVCVWMDITSRFL